jgi:hypothetical protein
VIDYVYGMVMEEENQNNDAEKQFANYSNGRFVIDRGLKWLMIQDIPFRKNQYYVANEEIMPKVGKDLVNFREQSPPDLGMILDTDYENYMVTIKCQKDVNHDKNGYWTKMITFYTRKNPNQMEESEMD